MAQFRAVKSKPLGFIGNTPEEKLVDFCIQLRRHLEDYGEISKQHAKGVLADVDGLLFQAGK